MVGGGDRGGGGGAVWGVAARTVQLPLPFCLVVDGIMASYHEG